MSEEKNEAAFDENTLKLGVKIKTDQDTAHKLWKGTPASLSDNSIKAVYFPGYDVKHVKAKEPSCMAEGNTEHWTITDDSGETTYYNNETPADVNKVSKAQVTIAIDSDAHEWGEPEYTWSSDKKTVTAKRVCKNNSVHIEEETANVISEITREATATENGERTYVAAFSNPAFKAQTRKEAIPKKEGVKDDPTPAPEPTPAPDPSDDVNKKGVDGTALGRGASAAAADKAITTMKSDKDPAGSRFAPLKLKSVKQGKNSVKLTWKKVSVAKTYVVYGNVCGKKNKMKKLTTVKKNTLTVKKIKKTLRKGTYHKFIVVALDKNRMVVSTSKVIHAATKGSKKKANPKGVTVKAKVDKNGKKLKKWTRTKAVAVKKGKTTTLKASITKAKNTTVRKHVGPRFESSNKKIVKVTAKGKVKGIKKGTAKIYVFAQNGVCRTISVTVR